MAITGVIFDKDGTLFDFQATWGGWSETVIAAEAAGDAVLAARLAAVLGYDPATRQFLSGAIAISDTTAEIAEALLPLLPGQTVAALQSRLNRRSLDLSPIPAADLPQLMARLQGMGLTLGLATNDAEAPARAHLVKAGILGRFTAILGYDSGYGGKPAPGQLLAFCALTGLAPGDCLMVGDSPHDLLAARAAGMRAVGVLTGPVGRDALVPLADVVLASVADLPGWIAGQG